MLCIGLHWLEACCVSMDFKACATINWNQSCWLGLQWSQWGLERISQDLPLAARTLLGPNEPNHHLQANLTPEDAAKLWPSLQKVVPVPCSTIVGK